MEGAEGASRAGLVAQFWAFLIGIYLRQPNHTYPQIVSKLRYKMGRSLISFRAVKP